MKIRKPKIVIENDLVKVLVEVHYAKGEKTLWYSLDKLYYDLVSELSDAYLVALLIPAMALGEDIYIEGTISEKLFYNLSFPLQKILQEIIPTLKIINLYPENICKQVNPKAYGVATGFSGGIDSFCTLADHYVMCEFVQIEKRFFPSEFLLNTRNKRNLNLNQPLKKVNPLFLPQVIVSDNALYLYHLQNQHY
jgi:hypothetical protein